MSPRGSCIALAMDPETLNDPAMRRDVIKHMFSLATEKDVDKFLVLMECPPIVPSEHQIANPDDPVDWHSMELVGKKGYSLSFAYFAGIGSVFVHTTPQELRMWGDAIPGDGSVERRRYLEAAARLACEGMPIEFVKVDPRTGASVTSESVTVAENLN